MSLPASLLRVCAEMKKSVLAKEFRITFHELNAGVSLENAFRHLSDRTKSPDVLALSSSIIQAEKTGMSLGEALRVQSKLMRETTRLKTKERILKVPVKMTIPLVLFFLPALFLVLAGPAYVQVTQQLSQQSDEKAK
jgi:tight adherence protein C